MAPGTYKQRVGGLPRGGVCSSADACGATARLGSYIKKNKGVFLMWRLLPVCLGLKSLSADVVGTVAMEMDHLLSRLKYSWFMTFDPLQSML